MGDSTLECVLCGERRVIVVRKLKILLSTLGIRKISKNCCYASSRLFRAEFSYTKLFSMPELVSLQSFMFNV
jgi:hypothetical protein